MCLIIHFLAFDISENFMTVMRMGIGNSGIGENGNGNRFLSWEWVRMGMGMGGNRNRNSPSRTPLVGIMQMYVGGSRQTEFHVRAGHHGSAPVQTAETAVPASRSRTRTKRDFVVRR